MCKSFGSDYNNSQQSVTKHDVFERIHSTVHWKRCCFYLLVGLEHVTLEDVRGAVSRDVAEYFEILRVVRNVEYPATQTTTVRKM